MKIGVIGLGHVGLPTAAALAEHGHEVYGCDCDELRLKCLAEKRLPFFEPGLAQLVAQNMEAGRLCFLRDQNELVNRCEVIFICLPTPSDDKGRADTGLVELVVKQIGDWCQCQALARIIAIKSTVPPGTCARLSQEMEGAELTICHVPEFLREGRAVDDALYPFAVVLGLQPQAKLARRVLLQLYEGIGCPICITGLETAELTKYALNGFLAMTISYSNMMAQVAECCGADWPNVEMIMRQDPRIGLQAYLRAGPGYGGSCLPKDVQAISEAAKEWGAITPLLDAAKGINEQQPRRIVKKLSRELGNLHGKKIALWGVAFKPGTDDRRHSPSEAVIKLLSERGAEVCVYDPMLQEFPDPNETLEGAAGLVVMYGCQAFREALTEDSMELMRQRVILDASNYFPLDWLQEMGVRYLGTGR